MLGSRIRIQDPLPPWKAVNPFPLVYLNLEESHMSNVNYYFTFKNIHPKYSRIYCRVTVPDSPTSYADARNKFTSKFGTEWASQYKESEVRDHQMNDWWNSFGLKIVDFDELEFVEPNPRKYDNNQLTPTNVILEYLKSTGMVDSSLHSVITAKCMFVFDKDTITILDANWSKIKKVKLIHEEAIKVNVEKCKEFIDEVAHDLATSILSGDFEFRMSPRVSARTYYTMISTILSWELTRKYVLIPNLCISVYQMVNSTPTEIIKSLVNEYSELSKSYGNQTSEVK